MWRRKRHQTQMVFTLALYMIALTQSRRFVESYDSGVVNKSINTIFTALVRERSQIMAKLMF